ncbi:serine/threonine protein phosphatase [Saccharomonospora piscinae]|uniref:Serine/threonine protein phosphatase n=1 Tax=Saccharomonospora piscinae TaxID=687388 RepID=A0A1V9A6N6_SACPI|nr:serine/threonine protein phosphatase [Saccharomonospora piscinae]
MSTSADHRPGPAAVGGDREQMRFLQQVSRQLAGSLNVRRTALRALGFAVPALGHWAMLAFFDSDQVSVYSHDSSGRATGPTPLGRLAPDHELSRLRRRGTTARYALPAGDRPEILDALVPSEALRAVVASRRPAEMLAVPLNIGGATNGVLLLARADDQETSGDVLVAEEFVYRVAATLESARLYEERGQMAEALQASLRPPELPELGGVRLAARYRPGAQRLSIGGDFYDVHGTPEDFTVVVGDVCGKGIDAAVYTGLARQTIRAAAFFDRSPARVLGALNEVLRGQLADRFVTAACVRFQREPESAELAATVGVAGHPPPLVLRADGTVDEVTIAGTVAGMIPGLTFAEAGVRLGEGDTMLLYTDGVDEARGPDDFYGHERLRLLLPEYAGAGPATLCEAVEQRVLEHLDGGGHDDIALLAVRNGA